MASLREAAAWRRRWVRWIHHFHAGWKQVAAHWSPAASEWFALMAAGLKTL